MKVYTKKNNGLRLLGEGMVFSKGQLMLKEQDGNTVTLNATDGSDASASDIQKKETELSNTVSAPGKQLMASFDTEDLNGVQTQQISPNDVRNDVPMFLQGEDGKIPSASKIQKAGKAAADAGVKSVVTPIGPMNNSVTPRKVMDEMRANSVPFTKTELTKFLKSI